MTTARIQLALIALGLGVIVGVGSSINDNTILSPNTLEALGQFVTGVMNSFVVWFGAPFALAYLFCHTKKQSIAIGAAFMTAAILSYFIYGLVTTTHPAPSDLKYVVLEWLIIAVAGGVIAGILGFAARQRTLILLVLAFTACIELARRLETSWDNFINIGENIIFIIIAIAVTTYAIATHQKNEQQHDKKPR